MSVFTGLYATVHQVFTFSKAGRARPEQILRLNDRIPTLPEVLKENGYHTVGFHGGGNVAAKFGFGRGFDRYERVELDTTPGEKRVLSFVSSMSERPDQRFFLFVHSYHVHAPYTPKALAHSDSNYRGKIEHKKGALRRMARAGLCESVARCFWSLVEESSAADARHLEDLYDAEITELDARVGTLLRHLAKLPGETLVVLIGDHGEEFLEHGAFEHRQIYNELLKVPLIIEHPRMREGMRIRSRVSLIDLLPTLLEMLGIEADLLMQGSSFLPLIATESEPREVYSEYPPFGLYALVGGEKKLILQGLPSRDMESYQKVELYDLRSDPAEKQNLADGDPDLHEMFERLTERVFENQELRNAIQRGDPPATDSLDRETIEQLEALGYIE
jgi:arylsulfatase A-like enzyme